MDERVLAEVIEDLDHMRQLLDRCVRRLRGTVIPDVAVANTAPAPAVSAHSGEIRAAIERQRQEIMAKVEQAKAQALASANAARTNGTMPGAGMPGIDAALRAMDPGKLEELQRLLAEATKDGPK